MYTAQEATVKLEMYVRQSIAQCAHIFHTNSHIRLYLFRGYCRNLLSNDHRLHDVITSARILDYIS